MVHSLLPPLDLLLTPFVPFALPGTLGAAVGDVAAVLSGGIAGAALALAVERLVARKFAERARAAAERIVSEAKAEADLLKKQAEVEAKEDLLKKREGLEAEVHEARKEVKEAERRVERREQALDERSRADGERAKEIEERLQRLAAREADLGRREGEAAASMEAARKELERVAGLTREEAQKVILDRLEKEVEHEQALRISRITERTREEAIQTAKRIITTAIQRMASAHTPTVTTSTVELPSDEMKGRIIGREGRNIRSFEQATGVDLIVDDTPGVVVISAFDPVRREIARRALDKLIADGRIHPARIEELVEETKEELNQQIQEIGNQAALDADVPGLHPKIITLLGRMNFRTSYGQNVLAHSIEVSRLSGLLGGELGVDVGLARRCGLLHDIGKAVDHDVEGGHPEIGADLARRYGEPPEVVNAIASHHEGCPQETIYAVVTQAADAISGARPGARRETIEKYIKRMERLESVAAEFKGVKSAYAIQAGREVRVVVDAAEVSDRTAAKLARDIAREIEAKLTYPGEVKVTLIRETRVIEYAK